MIPNIQNDCHMHNSDKIAILILAHRNPEQLEYLIKSLDDKRYDIFVHIDKKSKMRFDPPKCSYSSIYINEVHRVATYLNDFSLVDATCSLITTALALRGGVQVLCIVDRTRLPYQIK